MNSQQLKLVLSIESVRFPLTGIGRYTWELANELEHSGDFDSLLFLNKFKLGNVLPKEGSSSQGQSQNNSKSFKNEIKQTIKIIAQKSDIISEVYRRSSNYLKGTKLKNYEDHIFHGTNFYIPPFAGKKVATFHDLSPFTWAECNTPQKIRYMQKELTRTVENADRLIVPSESVRQELAEYFSYPLDKIHTIHLACSDDFRPREESQIESRLADWGIQYNQYSLFISTIEPRKNIITMIDAYARLPNSIKQQYPLILVGYKGWESDEIHIRIQEAEKEGWLKYLGYLAVEDLPILYSGARLFVFPTLYEGFGLPLLEAMSSGVPVVCSNNSSLPEVVGDAALTCDSNDIETLTKHMEQGLEDEEWRREAIESGFIQAKKFSWQKCAEETIAVYHLLSS